jgi:hypothetical protein
MTGSPLFQLFVMCSTRTRGDAGRWCPVHTQCSETGFSAVTSGSLMEESFSFTDANLPLGLSGRMLA